MEAQEKVEGLARGELSITMNGKSPEWVDIRYRPLDGENPLYVFGLTEQSARTFFSLISERERRALFARWSESVRPALVIRAWFASSSGLCLGVEDTFSGAGGWILLPWEDLGKDTSRPAWTRTISARLEALAHGQAGFDY